MVLGRHRNRWTDTETETKQSGAHPKGYGRRAVALATGCGACLACCQPIHIPCLSRPLRVTTATMSCGHSCPGLGLSAATSRLNHIRSDTCRQQYLCHMANHVGLSATSGLYTTASKHRRYNRGPLTYSCGHRANHMQASRSL